MADIFEKRKKRIFHPLAKKKQLKSNFRKVTDMRYSYRCKEYVVKIL